MTVDVIETDESWRAVGLAAIADRASAAALGHLGLDPDAWEISVLGCDDGRIAELNLDFRGKAGPTNVLSWPSAERGAAQPGTPPPPPDPSDPELGDIAISHDTCAREAAEAGRSLADHTAHLMVHGVLHLLGYDHETDADASLMENLETEILATMGVANPY